MSFSCTFLTNVYLQFQEGHEDEVRRLKKELKQTIDMYHAALKEALAAKQKVLIRTCPFSDFHFLDFALSIGDLSKYLILL